MLFSGPQSEGDVTHVALYIPYSLLFGESKDEIRLAFGESNRELPRGINCLRRKGWLGRAPLPFRTLTEHCRSEEGG